MAAASSRGQKLSVVGGSGNQSQGRRQSGQTGRTGQSARTRQSTRTRQSRQEYVYGDAVPEPLYDPQREREEERARQEQERQRKRRARQQQVDRQVARNRRRALYMSPGYVMFLGVAAAVALFVCVNYVNLQAQIADSAQNITAMQEELSELREQNNTRYNAATGSVNMADVQERASELGMIYASEDQIIEYSSPTSDYVRQYENIPEDGLLAQSDKRE